MDENRYELYNFDFTAAHWETDVACVLFVCFVYLTRAAIQYHITW